MGDIGIADIIAIVVYIVIVGLCIRYLESDKDEP